MAFAWGEYIFGEEHNPEWLPILPMVKGAYMAMKAAQEYLSHEKIIKIESWNVLGASKRGWTALSVATSVCSGCGVNINSVVGLVPIMPDLRTSVHEQWQAYNGLTFAFIDYVNLGLIDYLDTELGGSSLEILDPMYQFDRLQDIPVFIILSSSDEFMMNDWPKNYMDKIPGEKHVYVVPNTDHSLVTGILKCLGTIGSFLRSLNS